IKTVVHATLIALTLVLSTAPLAGTAALTIDYPAEGSLFPPDIAPPTFLWRDTSKATAWRIEISFASGGPPMRLASSGPRLQLGEIDPDCVSSSNEPPKVDPRQRAWKPDPATWAMIKSRSR